MQPDDDDVHNKILMRTSVSLYLLKKKLFVFPLKLGVGFYDVKPNKLIGHLSLPFFKYRKLSQYHVFINVNSLVIWKIDQTSMRALKSFLISEINFFLKSFVFHLVFFRKNVVFKIYIKTFVTELKLILLIAKKRAQYSKNHDNCKY